MQKIVPFKKEMKFEEEVAEITSISLEHALNKSENNMITGNFIINGEYKVDSTTTIIEKFNFDIPFDISVDDKYDTTSCNVEIDDFYYEIINGNKLMINIDILIDNLEEIKIISTEKEVYNINKESINRCVERESIIVDEKEKFIDEKDALIEDKEDFIDELEDFTIYKVYVANEDDTVESIINKYNSSLDVLEKYNDLSNIKKGTKIIIPSK